MNFDGCDRRHLSVPPIGAFLLARREDGSGHCRSIFIFASYAFVLRLLFVFRRCFFALPTESSFSCKKGVSVSVLDCLFALPVETSCKGTNIVGVSILGRGLGSGTIGRFSALADATRLKLTVGVA